MNTDLIDDIENDPRTKINEDGDMEIEMTKREFNGLQKEKAKEYNKHMEHHFNFLLPKMGIDGRFRRHGHVLDPAEGLHSYTKVDLGRHRDGHYTFAFNDDDITHVECLERNSDGHRVKEVVLHHEDNEKAVYRLKEMTEAGKAYLVHEKHDKCAFSDTPRQLGGRHTRKRPPTLSRKVDPNNCYVEDYKLHCQQTEHANFYDMMENGKFSIKFGHIEDAKRPPPKLKLDENGAPRDEHASAEIIFLRGRDPLTGLPVFDLEDPFLGHFCEYIDCSDWSSKQIEEMKVKFTDVLRNVPYLGDREATMAERYGEDAKMPAPRRRMMEKTRRYGPGIHTHVDMYSVEEGFFFDPKIGALVPNFYHPLMKRRLAERNVTPEQAQQVYYYKAMMNSHPGKYNTISQRRRLWGSVGNWVSGAVDSATNWIETAVADAIDWAEEAYNDVVAAVEDAWETVKEVGELIGSIITGQPIPFHLEMDFVNEDRIPERHLDVPYNGVIMDLQGEGAFAGYGGLVSGPDMPFGGECDIHCGGQTWDGTINIKLMCVEYHNENRACNIRFQLGIRIDGEILVHFGNPIKRFEAALTFDLLIDFKVILELDICAQCHWDLFEYGNPFTEKGLAQTPLGGFPGTIWLGPVPVTYHFEFNLALQIQVAVKARFSVGFKWGKDGHVGIRYEDDQFHDDIYIHDTPAEFSKSMEVEMGRVTISLPFQVTFKVYQVFGPLVIFEPFFRVEYQDGNQLDCNGVNSWSDEHVELGLGFFIKAGIVVGFELDFEVVSLDLEWSVDWTLIHFEMVYNIGGAKDGQWNDPVFSFLMLDGCNSAENSDWGQTIRRDIENVANFANAMSGGALGQAVNMAESALNTVERVNSPGLVQSDGEEIGCTSNCGCQPKCGSHPGQDHRKDGNNAACSRLTLQANLMDATGEYTNGESYVVTIAKGRMVKIYIHLHLESCCDYVRILNENEQEITSLNGLAEWTGEAAYIRFTSDGSVTGDGWRATCIGAGGSQVRLARDNVLQASEDGGVTWGPVCYKTFGNTEADVSCQELTKKSSVAGAYTHGRYGPQGASHPQPRSNMGDFVLSRLNCMGNETTLANCSWNAPAWIPMSGWTHHDCDPDGSVKLFCPERPCANVSCGGTGCDEISRTGDGGVGFVTPRGFVESGDYGINATGGYANNLSYTVIFDAGNVVDIQFTMATEVNYDFVAIIGPDGEVLANWSGEHNWMGYAAGIQFISDGSAPTYFWQVTCRRSEANFGRRLQDQSPVWGADVPTGAFEQEITLTEPLSRRLEDTEETAAKENTGKLSAAQTVGRCESPAGEVCVAAKTTRDACEEAVDANDDPCVWIDERVWTVPESESTSTNPGRTAALTGFLKKSSNTGRCSTAIESSISMLEIGHYLELNESGNQFAVKTLYVVEMDALDGKKYSGALCKARQIWIGQPQENSLMSFNRLETNDVAFIRQAVVNQNGYDTLTGRYREWAKTMDVADIEGVIRFAGQGRATLLRNLDRLAGHTAAQKFEAFYAQVLTFFIRENQSGGIPDSILQHKGEGIPKEEEEEGSLIEHLREYLEHTGAADIVDNHASGKYQMMFNSMYETGLEFNGAEGTFTAIHIDVHSAIREGRGGSYGYGYTKGMERKELNDLQRIINGDLDELALDSSGEVVDSYPEFADFFPEAEFTSYQKQPSGSKIRSTLRSMLEAMYKTRGFKMLLAEEFYTYCGDDVAKSSFGQMKEVTFPSSLLGQFTMGGTAVVLDEDIHHFGGVETERCWRGFASRYPIADPDTNAPIFKTDTSKQSDIIPEGGFVSCFDEEGADTAYDPMNCSTCTHVLDRICGEENPHCGLPVVTDWANLAIKQEQRGAEDMLCTGVQFTRADSHFQCVAPIILHDGTVKHYLCGRARSFNVNGNKCNVSANGYAETPNFPEPEPSNGGCTFTALHGGTLNVDNFLIRNREIGGADGGCGSYVKRVSSLDSCNVSHEFDETGTCQYENNTTRTTTEAECVTGTGICTHDGLTTVSTEAACDDPNASWEPINNNQWTSSHECAQWADPMECNDEGLDRCVWGKAITTICDKQDFLDSGLRVEKGEEFVFFSNGANRTPGFKIAIEAEGIEDLVPPEDGYLDLILIGAESAETKDVYGSYGSDAWESIECDECECDATDIDCDETCAEPQPCECDYIGRGTDVNVQFLCSLGDVCYNQVQDWCAIGENICQVPI